jgi:anti-repressor protein
MELITLTTAQIGGEKTNSVNARELHSFLEVGKDFSNWMKDRIDQYQFVESLDFEVFANSGVNPNGGRPAKEYAITLDMAKELSMVERNAKGKEARQYFIECEKRVKSGEGARIDVRDPSQLTSIAIQLIEVNKELEDKLEAMTPQVEAYERLAQADGSLCITDAAKSLQIRPKDLFAYLSARSWIYKRPGCGHWLGYQTKTTQGLLEHKVETVLLASGDERIREQVRVTPKGLSKLARLIKPALAAA